MSPLEIELMIDDGLFALQNLDRELDELEEFDSRDLDDSDAEVCND